MQRRCEARPTASELTDLGRFLEVQRDFRRLERRERLTLVVGPRRVTSAGEGAAEEEEARDRTGKGTAGVGKVGDARRLEYLPRIRGGLQSRMKAVSDSVRAGPAGR